MERLAQAMRAPLQPPPRGRAGGVARAKTAWRYLDGTFMPESEKEAASLDECERYAAGGRARARSAVRASDGNLCSEVKPMPKRVFLSFLAEDEPQVRGLRLLAANPTYDLEFYDESVRVGHDSTNADYVKSKIREKINRTSVTVCLISQNTHTSKWVDWELEESAKKKNKIIAMALKGVTQAVLLKLIKGKSLAFYPWDPANLTKLIGS
jgi:MTH538 TIR-like domain (DUF1863)